MPPKSEKPTVVRYDTHEWEFVYPPSIDNEETQETFWNAVEMLDNDDTKAEQVFKKLIADHPYFIDAYNHLSIAFRNRGKTFEILLTAEKAYRIGKECLPAQFDLKKDKLSWHVLDNRPFLRACEIYGLECQYHKNYAAAVDVYSENLSLNKDDNQGIRYLLLEVYFALKDYKRAAKLLAEYAGEPSIDFAFGAVALSILEGRHSEADRLLAAAVNTNRFFVEEVVKTRHIKPPPPSTAGEPFFDPGIAVGSVQEAYAYWERNKDLYKTKAVLDYFKSRQPSPEAGSG